MNQLYARLQAAVLAYDRALRAFGLVKGDQAFVGSAELDQLWANVLEAAQPEAEEFDSRGKDCHE